MEKQNGTYIDRQKQIEHDVHFYTSDWPKTGLTLVGLIWVLALFTSDVGKFVQNTWMVGTPVTAALIVAQKTKKHYDNL